MTDTKTLVRNLFTQGRPLMEQALDIAEQFRAFGVTARDNGIDWGQIKALLKAQILDERETDDESGAGDHVEKLIGKLDDASAYIDMLGLGANMNNKKLYSEKSSDGKPDLPVAATQKPVEQFYPSADDGDGIPEFLDRRAAAGQSA